MNGTTDLREARRRIIQAEAEFEIERRLMMQARQFGLYAIAVVHDYTAMIHTPYIERTLC